MRPVNERLGRWLLEHHEYIAPFIPNRYFPYRFVGGRIFLNLKESPMMLARALQLYEVEKIEVVRHFLKPGSIFVDVGANKGDFSLLAASLLDGTGSVFSFEPEPSNWHWLHRSIALNGYSNVRLYDIALADSNGTANLYLGERSGWHSLLKGLPHRSNGVIPVRTRTLDDVLEEAEQPRVDMIKIDVEGAELQVLKGARRALDGNKNIVLLIDVHPTLGVSPFQVCDFLADRGFGIYEMRSPFTAHASAGEDLQEILAYRLETRASP